MRNYVGIDVAKDVHWVSAIDQDARMLIDKAVQNDQPAIEALAVELRRLGPDLVIGLDVTGSIAAFLEAVLLAEGLSLVHVPGIAVNRASHGFAGGETRSDPRDARVIADLVRTRPSLRPIRPDEETTIAIRLLVARRRDLGQDQTRRVSRMRQLLASIHPGLERALDLTAKAPPSCLALRREQRALVGKRFHRTFTRGKDDVLGLAAQPVAMPNRSLAHK